MARRHKPAGRPPATGIKRDVPRKLYLTPDEAKRHDDARGSQPYSDFAREMIDEGITRRAARKDT